MAEVALNSVCSSFEITKASDIVVKLRSAMSPLDTI